MDSMQEQFSALSQSCELVKVNVEKIEGIKANMHNLVEQGFNVSASLDTLNSQQERYATHLEELVAKISELVVETNTLVAELK